MQLMLCQLISAVDLSRKSLNDRLSHVTIERSVEVCQSSDSNFLRKLSHEFSFKKTVILCHHNYFFFLYSFKKFPIIVSGRTFYLLLFCICLSLSTYPSLQFFFPNWILLFEKIQNNATCLNTIRDIEKLSTVLVSL